LPRCLAGAGVHLLAKAAFLRAAAYLSEFCLSFPELGAQDVNDYCEIGQISYPRETQERRENYAKKCP
jgi:hypothetical protein